MKNLITKLLNENYPASCFERPDGGVEIARGPIRHCISRNGIANPKAFNETLALLDGRSWFTEGVRGELIEIVTRQWARK